MHAHVSARCGGPWYTSLRRLAVTSVALILCLASSARAQTAPPPPAEPAKRSLPDKLSPLDVVLSNGSKLGVGMAAQLRLNVDNEGGKLGQGGERETDTNVQLRRVRVTLRGAFLDDRLRALMQLSFAPGNPELLDLFLEYTALPFLRVRAGQFKTPFTRHRGQSYGVIALTEWDPAAVSFGAERQIGVMVHDGMRGDGKLNYALGLFAGPNARAAFARGISDTYGETLPNRSSLRAPFTKTELHPEVVGLIGYSSRRMDNVAPTDPEGGPARVFASLSGAIDCAPESTQDFASRLAPELLLKAYHLSLNVVGYGGFFDATQGPWSLGMLGLTTELTYRMHPRFELAARYSRTDTLDRLRDDARTRAASIIASADPDDSEALNDQYAEAGRVRSQQEIALGFNVYIIGRNLAWQSDLALVRMNLLGTDADTDEMRFRSQLLFMM
jgi:hypothetical protein